MIEPSTPNHAPKPLVEVRHLVKYFPVQHGLLPRLVGWVQTVDQVSFSILRGETLGLVGESGCGKTTLARTLLRLIEPTSGAVYFDGANVFEMSRAELHLLRRQAQIIDDDMVAAIDPHLPLGKALAAFLALRPQFIIADEPGFRVDAAVQAQFFTLLKNMQGEFGLTCLFIAQSPALLEPFVDRLGVMYLGKLVELARRGELFGSPMHPYTQALLSAIPGAAGARPRITLPGEVPSPLHPPGGCRFHTRCPVAMDICSMEEPAFRPLSPAHWVACWRV